MLLPACKGQGCNTENLVPLVCFITIVSYARLVFMKVIVSHYKMYRSAKIPGSRLPGQLNLIFPVPLNIFGVSGMKVASCHPSGA